MVFIGPSSEEDSAETKGKEAERNLSLILELLRLSKDRESGGADPQVIFHSCFVCLYLVHFCQPTSTSSYSVVESCADM